MYENFDDIIKDGIHRYFEKRGIKTPSSKDLGKAFMDFYAKEIAIYLNHIYEDDVEEGFDCDGKGDLGVDFLLKKEDGSVIIFQSKYKGTRNNIDPDEISNFFQITNRVFNKSFLNNYGNENLKFQFKGVTADTRIDFIFITNHKLTPRIKEEFDHQKKTEESKNNNHTYYLKGFAEIKKEYTVVQTASEPIPDEVTIYIERVNDTLVQSRRPSYLDLSDLIDDNKRYKSIICTIKGTYLKSLWNQYPGSLFNYNIRGYLGDNPVNKKMRDTIDKEPEKFYFYNNGISAICTELTPVIDSATKDIKEIKCKDFQIINGAQTTSTIGNHKDDLKLQKVRILLRITKAEDLKSERKGLNKKIITYNNSQTIIKDSDFRSNDEIQSFLLNNFSNYWYRGVAPNEKLQYLPKRIKFTKKKGFLYVPIELLARVLYVYDNDPILIFKGTKSLFDITENGKYWQVFGEKGEELQVFDEKRMNKTVAVFMLWTKLDEIIQQKTKEFRNENKENSIDYQALLAKWHFLWIYAEILRKLYSDDLPTLYRKIVNGKPFESKENNFIETWFNRIFFKVAEIIEKNYKSERSIKGEDEIQAFNLKNWLRSNQAFDELKDNFKRLIKEDYPMKIIEK